MGQVYKTWDVRKKREIVTGLYPVAASSGGAAMVRLHDPIEYCIATYVIESFSDWPYIPSPSSLADEGYVLTHSEQTVHVPCPDSGGRIFSVSGLYLYAKEGQSSLPNDDIKSGVVPGDSLSQDSAILKKAYFQLGLLQSNYFNNNPVYPPA